MTAPSATGATGLAPWSEPDRFLGHDVDDEGLAASSLNCLNHCLRDALIGHGVRSRRMLLARPLGVACSVDRTMRMWLISPAEWEFDAPRYNGPLRARWVPVADRAQFRRELDRLLESGRVGIARANRWLVPWLSQSTTASADWHTSVFLPAGSGGTDSLRVVDRQFGGETVAVREHTIPIEDLDATLVRGMALLDYRFDDPSATHGYDPSEIREQAVRSLVEASIRNMTESPEFPAENRAYGPDVVDEMKRLFGEDGFAMVDSRQTRMSLRWNMTSCIDKFVLGNRVVLADLFAEHDPPGGRFGAVRAEIERSGIAWKTLARAMGLAARRPENHRGSLLDALDSVGEADAAVVRELSAVKADVDG